jgi:adenylate cyclase class 2
MRRYHETEIKLEVLDARALKRRLAELGFRPIQRRHFESNTLFDFADLRLRRARSLLRLRRADKQWTLTFKGAPQRSRQYKIRRETETAVDDGEQLREIFLTLGLHKGFCYEKYRTVYASGAGSAESPTPLLVYDETPIGNYLELEGPKRWIDRVARRLGYGRADYITASYAALYCQWCRERGEKPGDMMFSPRKS